MFGDDADDFKLERHPGDNGELLTGPKKTTRSRVVWIWARESPTCVSRHLTNEALFIPTGRILWATTLKCAREENEKDMRADTNAFVDIGVFRRVLTIQWLPSLAPGHFEWVCPHFGRKSLMVDNEHNTTMA